MNLVLRGKEISVGGWGTKRAKKGTQFNKEKYNTKSSLEEVEKKINGN